MVDEQFTYLAAAESRQLFAVVTPYMLTRCTQELYCMRLWYDAENGRGAWFFDCTILGQNGHCIFKVWAIGDKWNIWTCVDTFTRRKLLDL